MAAKREPGTHLQAQAGILKMDRVKLQIDAPVVDVVTALDGKEASVGSGVIRHKPV